VPERSNGAVSKCVWGRQSLSHCIPGALDERALRESGICGSEELYLDREQIERDAWLDTLRFPPF
jgi:hypothetical protein